jgi:hypothetical protein
MCQITINPTFAGTPTATGASVTVSGTVAMSQGDPSPCAQLQVSILCAHSGEASSNNTTPDAQGNWTTTLPVTCACNDMVEVNVRCLSPATLTCQAAANGPIDCSGGGTGTTGTGGTGTGGGTGGTGTGTSHCRPKLQLLGFSIVLSCPLVLFVTSVGWGTALGMFLFYICLGPKFAKSIGPGIAAIAITAASIALLGTLIYWHFCRKCLCWYWLLIWRVLWLGGILAAWFRQPICGANCKITSYIGAALMILGLVALFEWKRTCPKTICDAAYEGLLFTTAVFFTVVVPPALAFSQCVGSLSAAPTPWGAIILGSAFALFIIILFINSGNSNCSTKYPPPEWDF